LYDSTVLCIYVPLLWRNESSWIKYFFMVSEPGSDTRQPQNKGNGAQPWQPNQKRIMSANQSKKKEVLKRATRHMISTPVKILEILTRKSNCAVKITRNGKSSEGLASCPEEMGIHRWNTHPTEGWGTRSRTLVDRAVHDRLLDSKHHWTKITIHSCLC